MSEELQQSIFRDVQALEQLRDYFLGYQLIDQQSEVQLCDPLRGFLESADPDLTRESFARVDYLEEVFRDKNRNIQLISHLGGTQRNYSAKMIDFIKMEAINNRDRQGSLEAQLDDYATNIDYLQERCNLQQKDLHKYKLRLNAAQDVIDHYEAMQCEYDQRKNSTVSLEDLGSVSIVGHTQLRIAIEEYNHDKARQNNFFEQIKQLKLQVGQLILEKEELRIKVEDGLIKHSKEEESLARLHDRIAQLSTENDELRMQIKLRNQMSVKSFSSIPSFKVFDRSIAHVNSGNLSPTHQETEEQLSRERKPAMEPPGSVQRSKQWSICELEGFQTEWRRQISIASISSFDNFDQLRSVKQLQLKEDPTKTSQNHCAFLKKKSRNVGVNTIEVRIQGKKKKKVQIAVKVAQSIISPIFKILKDTCFTLTDHVVTQRVKRRKVC